LHCSRNTLAEIYELSDVKGVTWDTHLTFSNHEILRLLYPEKENPNLRKVPDYNLIHKELARSGVTLTLLWSEYCEKSQAEGLIPYQYTQFCDYYRYYIKKTKATMRIKRKPGELLEVDWAGTTLFITDNITGELIPAYIFVATLSCSQYSYAEAFSSMKTEEWINAHIHAYQFFQGVTRILVPDNLKTGVLKHTKSEVILNKAYQEMAEYYGTAIIPARPYSPKDKPNAEGSVGIISTWIIASLRNERFFSFSELNKSIKSKLTDFNQKPFQKKIGCRLSAFEEEEKSFLMPLPANHYELSSWATATIQMDYLINVDKCQYSVPYEYIGHSVDIRFTYKTIEVFYKNIRIASHLRRFNAKSPIVLPEHMPENHKRYLSWNRETFLEWAKSAGKSESALKTF
jgi:transposase